MVNAEQILIITYPISYKGEKMRSSFFEWIRKRGKYWTEENHEVSTKRTCLWRPGIYTAWVTVSILLGPSYYFPAEERIFTHLRFSSVGLQN